MIVFPAVPHPSRNPVVDPVGVAAGPAWYWALGSALAPGPCVRSLLDGYGAGIPAMQRALVRLVKRSCDTALPDGSSLAELVHGRLLDALRADSHCLTADVWGMYPGHAGRSEMLPALSRLLGDAPPLAGDRYLPDLLIRHTPAVKAAYARRRGETATFANQIRSVHLSPRYARLIRGRRVLVLDDYITLGFSAECARLLLMQAGAAGVVFVSLGRCGRTYRRQSLATHRDWNPFAPMTLTEADFAEQVLAPPPRRDAIAAFRSAYCAHSVRPDGRPISALRQ